MAVNQRQIADRLGVSVALVSRVLSGKAAAIGIAPRTIERVARAAAEMGYVPNAAALGLKGKATKTIGVAVYDFNDPFFGALVRQIQIQAREHRYSLVLAGFLNRVPDGQDLQALHKHAIDGLVVIGTDLAAGWLEGFRQVPVARIGHGMEGERSVRVAIDEAAAARLLANHLAATGRRRVAYLHAALPAHRLRAEAFAEAARGAGLGLVVAEAAGPDPFAAGAQAAARLVREDAADALACANDQVAMGALHALHAAGIGVPGQVAVTGFDDIPAAAHFIPPLTTVRQPLAAMAQQAFRAVVEAAGPGRVLLPGELVVRRTTTPTPGLPGT